MKACEHRTIKIIPPVKFKESRTCHSATMEKPGLKMKHSICFLKELSSAPFPGFHMFKIFGGKCRHRILDRSPCTRLSPPTIAPMKTVQGQECKPACSKTYSVLIVAVLYHRSPGVSCLEFGMAVRLTVGLLRRAFYVCVE